MLDSYGRPLPGAAVSWRVTNGNGQIEQADTVAAADGAARARWQLGTKASDVQSVNVEARAGNHRAATVTVTAAAVPVEVATLAITAETTDVHLGAPVVLHAEATDPFGNQFVPATLRFVSLDTGLVRVDSTGLASAQRRGYVRVLATANGVQDSAWMHAVQTVQAIVVSRDTLRFHALGQAESLSVALVDDHAFTVVDSLPSITATDTALVRVVPGLPIVIRSVGNGTAVLHLAVGNVTRDVSLAVRQRTAKLSFAAPILAFDALHDTTRAGIIALDSLGVPVQSPRITFASSDTTVATIDSAGLVTVHANGSVLLSARSLSGVTATIPATVAQRVAAVTVARDTLKFEALHAVMPLGAVARDRLGSPVIGSIGLYFSGDTSVVTVDATGTAHAAGNGAAAVLAIFDADTALVSVHVQQRPAVVHLTKDTLRFDALGAIDTVEAAALDSLGSPVVGGIDGLTIGDTSVVHAVASATVLEARANGVASVVFTVAGLVGRVTAIVHQVPTRVDAAVTFANPVITLPVGASLPMACSTFDRNGFATPESPLVTSVRGTIGGTCADAHVQHSGYDTVTVVAGVGQVRIPVIVAADPDSVGVLAAALPLSTVARDSFVGEDLSNPLILSLRPLVADILSAYGNPTTNLGRARAIRDWVARTAVSPDPAVHPDGSTSNLSVLPPGTTWGDVNQVLSPDEWDADRLFWDAYYYEGYAILNRLLGTLDTATGIRADDGLMVYVGGARYRIRDIHSYHYTLCTYQAIVANALWAAAGLQGMRATTLDHDPATVFIPELARWVYEDPTFSEEYLLDGTGDPLSATDLLTISTNGQATRLQPTKLVGPTFDPEPYIATRSYLNVHPEGMVVIGSQLYNRVVGQFARWRGRYVQVDVPRLATAPAPLNDPSIYAPVAPNSAFPTLGVVVSDMQVQDSVYVVHLSSTFPSHDHFERRVRGGLWEPVAAQDVLPVGACVVEYRSVDGSGNISATTSLDVWAPRAPGFPQSGDPASPRRAAQYCT